VQQRAGDETAEPSPVALLDDAPPRRLLSEADAEQLVLTVLGQHADALLRTARRHSLNPDDAQDAYQRGLEILLRHARRLEPERAHQWVHTVVKHEAMALRRTRQRDMAPDEIDFDLRESEHASDPADALLRLDRVQRSAAALRQLKPQEVQALWLKASGHSYEEIGERQGWTRTKVNRCISEGRRAFLGRYESLESGEECERWVPLLSALLDGEAKAKDAQALRGHLRSCPGCRAALRALHEGGADVRVLFPVPLVIGERVAERQDETAALVLRVYEAIVGGVHERATASVMRVQAFVEGASAAKVGAVAASAAAVAGGGTVAVQQVRERGMERPPVQAGPAAAAPVQAQPAPAVRTTAASSVTRVASAARRAAQGDVAAARRRADAAAAAQRRRAAERAMARQQAAAASSRPAGSEFSLAAPAAAPAPSGGAASGGSTATGSSSAPAGAEFGP
jgi:RNA polymerase sigma factor (sigma-70 family)